MTVVYVDAKLTDDERREKLFAGDIFVFTPTAGTLELINFARRMAEEAFAPHFPPDAQHHMEAQAYVDVLADLKPSFINHPYAKDLLRQIFGELGCAVEETYLDVPRLRTMTSDYLNAGLTYQFHVHRDTWFSAPMCQINWWMPVYEVTESNIMAFHPRYFSEKVPNSSDGYAYDTWVATGRTSAAKQVTMETRWQPEATEPVEKHPEIRVVTPPGGILMFSGAQLHSTVPNTSGKTRFSIDFRTVNRQDVATLAGAQNVDSAATGTTLGDFLRSTDLEQLPADLIAAYSAPR
ncbi:hypothetical protein F4553_005528 [Allocatelliglobosispora scoriae]|uniref:Phytanoyl-CoA dioxygenase family protein n=1 Tax=Allocatelliglobosispora scoriae TaxID=643052 RepID=A0A841BV72_9ACTN|nr:hypothetical protein [Allocatelliglobosispora scoriae]MBB5872094.1 hypothetical protein [Allocatelliglobosispora scoriae]